MARAGIQIINPNTGKLVIDERWRGLALQASSSGALFSAVGASGNIYYFGYPSLAAPAHGEAALIVKDGSGNVCFDSRLRYVNVVDVFEVARGCDTTTHTTVTTTVATKTYTSGRTYAVIAMTGNEYVVWHTISGGAIASDLWTADAGVTVSGATVTVQRTTMYSREDSQARPAWVNPPPWRFMVVDVTGMTASSSPGSLSTPSLSISDGNVPAGTTITLSWAKATRSPANGTVAYVVHWYRASDGVTGTLASTTALSTTTSGSVVTTYTYYVVASDSGGSSQPSNQVQMVTTTPYTAISGVAASPTTVTGSATGAANTTVNSSQTTISWSGGNTATVSWAYSSGTSGLTWHQTGSTAHSVTGYFSRAVASNGTITSVYKATVSDGTSSGTANVTVQLSLTVPQALNAPTLSISDTTAPVNQTITLSWTASTRVPVNGTVSYTVHWSRASDGATGTLAATTALSTTTGGSVATTYTYYVVASDNGGSSPNSNSVQIVRVAALSASSAPTSLSGTVFTVPGNPASTTVTTSVATNVTVTGGSGTITYSWERVSGDTSIAASSQSSSSTKFYGTVQRTKTITGTWRCKVTRGGTSVYTNNVSISLTYSSNL